MIVKVDGEFNTSYFVCISFCHKEDTYTMYIDG